ncbi:MAG: peptidoglycan DD-metalloendopeptidase family protein [Leptospiraceae bacterium]|nr:peptidoglycan DD-metalloendopeptidase family protein [Leptospiraceae bacterium]
MESSVLGVSPSPFSEHSSVKNGEWIERDSTGLKIQKWTEVKDLRVGDIVALKNKSEHPIKNIRQYKVSPTKVYNIEVEDNHNYFVGEVGVWVHNYPGEKIMDTAIDKSPRTVSKVLQKIDIFFNEMIDGVRPNPGTTNNRTVKNSNPETINGEEIMLPTETVRGNDGDFGCGKFECSRGKKRPDGHQSIDTIAKPKEIAVAPFSGKVTEIAKSDSNAIYIRSSDGKATAKILYLQPFSNIQGGKNGTEVTRGQAIGVAKDIREFKNPDGTSKYGKDITNHVHTEIKVNGRKVDPLQYTVEYKIADRKGKR